jgi:hypothetical protein
VLVVEVKEDRIGPVATRRMAQRKASEVFKGAASAEVTITYEVGRKAPTASDTDPLVALGYDGSSADRRGMTMAVDERPVARIGRRGRAIDPLAEQAATLLAKAMVTSHDRDGLWERFHSLVVDQVGEFEEAPIRAALEELEGRGVRLEAVARYLNDRLGTG